VGPQFGGGSGKLATTGIGVLLGGLLGSDVGRSLDRADQLAMIQATERSLESGPTGQVSSWQNPDSGHSGTVTPLRTYQIAQGSYCREFQQSITVGGADSAKLRHRMPPARRELADCSVTSGR
jgi:surface antigen